MDEPKKAGRPSRGKAVKKARISCRIDDERALFIETYKAQHNTKKDIDVVNAALDALKEKEYQKQQQEVREVENLIYIVLHEIGDLSNFREGDNQKYLEKLKEKLSEIHSITKKKG